MFFYLSNYNRINKEINIAKKINDINKGMLHVLLVYDI